MVSADSKSTVSTASAWTNSVAVSLNASPETVLDEEEEGAARDSSSVRREARHIATEVAV